MASTSSKTDGSPPGAAAVQEAASDSRERVLVGRVTRPHGVRGDVKIEILSDVPDRFKAGRDVLLVAAGRSARRRIASSRPIKGGAIVHFDDCESRDQAEALRGARLEVRRADVPPAPAGMYYHFELLGCRCVDAELGELGEVVAVVEDGGGLLLEVAGGGRTVPVPFVEPFLESVDVAGRQIRLRLPAGLVETCESAS